MAVADGLQASCLASSCLLSLSLVRPRRRLSSVPTAKCRGRRAQRQSRSAVAPLLKPTALLPGRALTVPSTAAPWIRRGQARPKTRGPVRRRLATIDCLARKPIKMRDPAQTAAVRARCRPFLPSLHSHAPPCACRKSNTYIQMMESAKKWRGQNVTNGMYCSRQRRVLVD